MVQRICPLLVFLSILVPFDFAGITRDPYVGSLVSYEMLSGIVQSLSRKPSLPASKVRRINLLNPHLVGDNGIADDCDSDSDFKCAFEYSPSAFYLAMAGLCLYVYGYVSAKAGYGNAKISVATFFLGPSLLV